MDPVTVGGYIAAAILAFMNWRLKRGDVWQGEAEAWRAKAERLEGEFTAFKAEFETYKRDTDAAIYRLETDNRRLAELPSNREAVHALEETVISCHAEIMAALQGA